MTRFGTVLVLLLPLLAGCALFESKATRAMRASPDYRAGYSDGCGSANSNSANPRADPMLRNETAYAGNRAYRMGWGEGFGSCRGPAQMNNTGSMNPLNR
jgi:hypothetical protein